MLDSKANDSSAVAILFIVLNGSIVAFGCAATAANVSMAHFVLGLIIFVCVLWALNGKQMPIKAIYLDCDGVIVNFVQGCLKLWDLDFVDDKPGFHQINGWDHMPVFLSEQLGREVSESEFWEVIASKGSDFWADLDWLPWGKEVFNLCREHTDAVVLMTTPTEEPSCAAGKIEWINRNMPEDWRRRYALTPCKHHMAHPGAVLIDDSPDNNANFRAHGGSSFMWPMPWNDPEWHTRDPLAELRYFLEQQQKVVPKR